MTPDKAREVIAELSTEDNIELYTNDPSAGVTIDGDAFNLQEYDCYGNRARVYFTDYQLVEYAKWLQEEMS